MKWKKEEKEIQERQKEKGEEKNSLEKDASEGRKYYGQNQFIYASIYCNEEYQCHFLYEETLFNL